MASTVALRSLQQLADAVLSAGMRTVSIRVRSRAGTGALFLSQGRLSWAAVPQTRRFLSERLAEVGVNRERLDQVRLANRPLSALVADGLLSQDSFSRLLFEHSIESLHHLVGGEIDDLVVEPWQQEPPPFSFPFVTVLAELVSRVSVVPTLGFARPPDDTTAFVCVNDGEVQLPARVLGTRVPDLRLTLELAASAAAVMGKLGEGTVSFRNGTQCWSVFGNAETMVVSSGDSSLSYWWMVGQKPTAWPRVATGGYARAT